MNAITITYTERLNEPEEIAASLRQLARFITSEPYVWPVIMDGHSWPLYSGLGEIIGTVAVSC